jgi:hypothetical protein
MFSNQNRDAIRRSDRNRRPMVESLDGRLLLTVIPGSHLGLATTDAVAGSHVGSAIIGRHIGSVTEMRQGDHIGTSVTVDFRQGDHIGTAIVGQHIGTLVTAELERKH